jgi:RNA polymerase sigma-70 factor (ECF subfamily)
VVQRDRSAFATLERAYEDVVYRFFLFKTNDRGLASRLTSDVFTTAWDSIERYPWRDFSFHVWILRIAKAKLERETGELREP